MPSVLKFLCSFVSFSTIVLAVDWWEPGDYSFNDQGMCQDYHDVQEDSGSNTKSEACQLKTLEIRQKEPQLEPFTIADLLSDFPQGGRYSEVTWYVEDKKFLVLKNFHVKNGVLKKGEICLGSLVLDGIQFHQGEKIFSADPGDNKENENPF
jgi:hypothetical protein